MRSASHNAPEPPQTYDITSGLCTGSGPLPLSVAPADREARASLPSTGISLSWVSFTSEGLLAAADSLGVIRVRWEPRLPGLLQSCALGAS